MRQTQAGSVQLSWDEIGAGAPAIVAVSQWFLSSRSMRVSPLIADLSSRHRVVVYDRRGTGESDRPGPPYNAARDGQDLGALLEAVAPDGAVLLGLGIRGTQTALSCAMHHPQRVRALVCVGGTPKWAASAEWPYGIQAGTWHNAFAGVLREEVPGPLPGDPALASAIEVDWRTTGPEAAIDILHHTLNDDLRPILGRIRAPALIVHLEQDRYVSFEAAKWLADSLVNGQLELFDAGRDLPLSAPTELSAHIDEFLSLVVRDR